MKLIFATPIYSRLCDMIAEAKSVGKTIERIELTPREYECLCNELRVPGAKEPSGKERWERVLGYPLVVDV